MRERIGRSENHTHTQFMCAVCVFVCFVQATGINKKCINGLLGLPLCVVCYSLCLNWNVMQYAKQLNKNIFYVLPSLRHTFVIKCFFSDVNPNRAFWYCEVKRIEIAQAERTACASALQITLHHIWINK